MASSVRAFWRIVPPGIGLFLGVLVRQRLAVGPHMGNYRARVSHFGAAIGPSSTIVNLAGKGPGAQWHHDIVGAL
ncbi:MAG: hypothetical protein EOS70_06785 [Mesorhizobium sp.]|uniref:hypothetical protein n=1 Tax=Mesorhizobium sp. TaxID=1871066 RepID=UPI000FE671B3|nr:hypothetical protein [Mesorhizobium sp.]RWC36129.1 MAG: hypothetical protein EOS70_06785 [Mesorhizobium sp.]